MKTQTLLIGAGIIAAGFVAVTLLSKKIVAAAATTPTTAAAAPGSTVASQIGSYASEANQLLGFLSGSSNNSASTNSTSGVSSSGNVSTSSPVQSAYDDASDLWDMYG